MTKTELARTNNAIIIQMNKDDCGRMGRLFELWCANETNSRKTKVARQNRIDLYINENGKRKTVECASNGHKFYDKDVNKTDYVIYFLNIKNSTTKNKQITIEPRIIEAKLFWDTILKYKLYKKTYKNGLEYGYNIQPSSRFLWDFLQSQPIYKKDGQSFLEWVDTL